MYQYKIEKNLLFTQQQLKMMNNFSLSSSVWLLVATVSFTACQSDDQATYLSTPTMSHTAAHVAQSPKLSAAVSLNEASHAASSFAPQRKLAQSPRTAMSLAGKSVTADPYSMTVINGSDGQPAIYVINYKSGGWLLLGASKNYTPVLAFSPTGHFDTGESSIPLPLKAWIDHKLTAVTHSKSLGAKAELQHRAEWTRLLGTGGMNVSIKPKRALSDNEAGHIFMQKMNEMQSQGYTLYFYNGSGYINNSELDPNMVNQAQGNSWPEYDWQTYSFVAEKQVTQTESCPNFVNATWGQGNLSNASIPSTDYNSECPPINGIRPYAGCGPVAAAQLLYYYKWPDTNSEGETIDWPSMYPNASSTATAKLLADIGAKAGAVYGLDGTSTTFDGLVKAFKKYHYDKKYNGNHSASMLWAYISHYFPAIERAELTRNGETRGHAWLVSGGTYTESHDTYEVYAFVSESEVGCLGTYNVPISYKYMLYMNWGWNGSSNGYFDDDATSFMLEGKYTSWSNRKDLIVTKQ